MTTHEPIEVVKKSVEVELTKRFIDDTRKMSPNGFKYLTDEEIVEALVEDILNRYFNTEYFDIDALIQSS